MTYDNEITLVQPSYDMSEINQTIRNGEEPVTILCKVKSAKRSEFHNNAERGYKPELVFVIHRFEFNNQPEVIFNGERYTVIRTYMVGVDEIELLAGRTERRVRN